MKYPRASRALRQALDPTLKRACLARMMLLCTISNLGLSRSGTPQSNPGFAPVTALIIMIIILIYSIKIMQISTTERYSIDLCCMYQKIKLILLSSAAFTRLENKKLQNTGGLSYMRLEWEMCYRILHVLHWTFRTVNYI